MFSQTTSKWRTLKYKGVALYKEFKDIVTATVKLLLVVVPISTAFRIGVPSLTVEEFSSLVLLVLGVTVGFQLLRKV